MAQRSSLEVSPGMGLIPSLVAPETEEPRASPFRASDFRSNLRKAVVGPPFMGETVFEDDDAVSASVPGTNELRAGLDPFGQFEPPVWLGLGGSYQLVKQALMLARETTVGPLLQ